MYISTDIRIDFHEIGASRLPRSTAYSCFFALTTLYGNKRSGEPCIVEIDGLVNNNVKYFTILTCWRAMNLLSQCDKFINGF